MTNINIDELNFCNELTEEQQNSNVGGLALFAGTAIAYENKTTGESVATGNVLAVVEEGARLDAFISGSSIQGSFLELVFRNFSIS